MAKKNRKSFTLQYNEVIEQALDDDGIFPQLATRNVSLSFRDNKEFVKFARDYAQKWCEQVQGAISANAKWAAQIAAPHVREEMPVAKRSHGRTASDLLSALQERPGSPRPDHWRPLENVVREEGRVYLVLDLGNGSRAYSYDESLAEPIKEAIHFCEHYATASHLFADANRRRDLALGFLIGSLQARMVVRQHDASVRKGKRRAEQARTAGKARQRLTDEQQRAAGREVERLIKAGRSRSDVCDELAVQYRCCSKTIERYHTKHFGQS